MSDTTTTPHITDWPFGALIGFGQSWKTYEDPSDTEKVIKIAQLPGDMSPGFTASELISKIIHVLLPENVPDIYESGLRSDGTRQIKVQKVHFHPDYARLVTLKNKPKLTDDERNELQMLRLEHQTWTQENARAQIIAKQLNGYQIAYDYTSLFNIVRTPENTPVYIDEMMTYLPWNTFCEYILRDAPKEKQEEIKKLMTLFEAIPHAKEA